MANRRELHVYDYVNGSYEAVLEALLADPLTVFQNATTAAQRGEPAGAELHAHAGPLEIGAEIEIDIRAIEEARSPDDHPATKLTLEWRATRRPDLFPTMCATLLVYALTPTETQLDLAGTYAPPLGVVGGAIDAIAMRGIAEEAVENFIREVAGFLRRTLAADHAA